MTLEDAIRLALDGHRGQLDQAGQDYILHVLAVALRLRTPKQRMAGVLHDWREDTGGTADELRQRGCPEDVIAALDALTKREGESKLQAAERAAADPIALAVKMADNAENRNLERLPSVTQRDVERALVYEAVRRRLTAATLDALQDYPDAAQEIPLESLLQPVAYELPLRRDTRGMRPCRIERESRPDGTATWAVRVDGACLARDGVWEVEPQPSSRLPDFLQRCRFPTLQQAAAAALPADEERQREHEQLQQQHEQRLRQRVG